MDDSQWMNSTTRRRGRHFSVKVSASKQLARKIAPVCREFRSALLLVIVIHLLFPHCLVLICIQPATVIAIFGGFTEPRHVQLSETFVERSRRT